MIGGGDPVPLDEPDAGEDDDDIEDNLLKIPGVELEPVDVAFKVNHHNLSAHRPSAHRPSARMLAHVTRCMLTCDLTCMQIFEGQHMPRADPSLKTGFDALDRLTRQKDKEECDPYVKVSFSGRSIACKHINNTYNPVWNQEVHMLANVPSLCDKLQIQVGSRFFQTTRLLMTTSAHGPRRWILRE